MKSNLVNLQTSLLLSSHQSHSSCDRSIISCCVVLWLYLKITTNNLDVILIASTQQRLANINQFLNLSIHCIHFTWSCVINIVVVVEISRTLPLIFVFLIGQFCGDNSIRLNERLLTSFGAPGQDIILMMFVCLERFDIDYAHAGKAWNRSEPLTVSVTLDKIDSCGWNYNWLNCFDIFIIIR